MNSTVDRINRVYDAINGKIAAPFVKGELVIDEGFARAFLEWIDAEKARASTEPENAK
jgi:hypothetical protein